MAATRDLAERIAAEATALEGELATFAVAGRLWRIYEELLAVGKEWEQEADRLAFWPPDDAGG